MKIVCSKSTLVKAVGIVSKAVSTKTTMTILECILIDATSQVIRFTGNDMELGIQTEVEGEIIEHGMIAIDAKLFSEIVRKLPENDVVIETGDKEKMTITCEKAKFVLSGKPGDEFAYLPVVEKEESLQISQFTLKEMIRQTIFSISDSESNKMMSGVLFEIIDNHLRLVTLDGHRISIRKVELKDPVSDRKLIIPGKYMNEISKILSGEAESMVDISYTSNHIVFEFDKTIIVSRLIEGEYFRINHMLSKDYETVVRVNKRECLNCVERALLVMKESDKKPLIVDVVEDTMSIAIKSQLGSLDEDLLVEKEGKDIKIGFNPRFLADALRVIDEEEVTLYMMNAKAPCFIKNKEESYIYLILPVNFSDIKD